MLHQTPPQSVADALGRPVGALQELDRRPLWLAFVEGRYETYVVRDVVTSERLEITLDVSSGCRVDPTELQSRDRQLAAVRGRKLEPRLLDVLLRHPELERVQVRLRFSLQPLKPEGSGESDWSDPDVRHEFQSGLSADLQELCIDLHPQVPADSPVMSAILSASEIVRLGGSIWIQSIELAAEPEVLDE